MDEDEKLKKNAERTRRKWIELVPPIKKKKKKRVEDEKWSF